MRLALRISGIVVMLVGLFLVLDGITVATGIGWGGDVDLDRTGKAQVAAAFGFSGLIVAFKGVGAPAPTPCQCG
jgi:hypothetical protein